MMPISQSHNVKLTMALNNLDFTSGGGQLQYLVGGVCLWSAVRNSEYRNLTGFVVKTTKRRRR